MALLDAFSDLTDPRRPALVEHHLLDMVGITLCALCAGADTWVDVAGCLVTVDAMGGQRAIAQQILDQGAAYVLALKENQETLYQEVVDCFAAQAQDDQVQVSQDMQSGKAHGRVERRAATIITDDPTLAWLQARHPWPGLQAVGRIAAERRLPDGTVQRETRYYLLSLPLDGTTGNRAVRAHWGIENGAHWILDMAFGDDASRVRVGHGAANMALRRRLVLNVFHQDHAKPGGVKSRRLQAGWDLAYLLHLLALLAGTTP